MARGVELAARRDGTKETPRKRGACHPLHTAGVINGQVVGPSMQRGFGFVCWNLSDYVQSGIMKNCGGNV